VKTPPACDQPQNERTIGPQKANLLVVYDSPTPLVELSWLDLRCLGGRHLQTHATTLRKLHLGQSSLI
jgi:hypothetical protein